MQRYRESGFTYLALMMVVLVMGIVLASVGEGWHAAARREKEAELLFAGNQIRTALVLYYAHSPPQMARHPASLEQLLMDPRSPSRARYLRKIYVDPMTDSSDWGLIRGAAGEIYGVHSLSQEKPLKKENFSRANRHFEGANSYAEWVFMFAPGQFSSGPMSSR